MIRRHSGKASILAAERAEAPVLSLQFNFVMAFALSLGATGVIASMIFLYANYGGDWVAGLNRRVGEVVAAEAVALAEMGDLEAALERYQEALAVPFDDPKQRFWTLRRYGELLLNEGRTSEATRALGECLSLNPSDSITLGLLARAHRAEGKFVEMAEVARRWGSVSREAGQLSTEAVADLYLGEALEKLGDSDGALKAYLDGVKAQPHSDCAHHAAVLLDRLGRSSEALAILDAYIPHAAGWRAESAEKLRSSLQTRSTP